MKLFAGIFVLITVLSVTAPIAAASDLPQFSSCVNPIGEIKAQYESGTHGIAGKPGVYQGKDVVYTLSENALTQCFCASDGNGIQTNWVKAASFSESDIKVLQSQGWVYIPNGALWGLDNEPYLAQNSDFSCKSSNSGGSSDNSSSSNSSSNNSGSGSVLGGASAGIGQVLGLASTGNIVFVLATAFTSAISLFTGLILKKRARKFSK